MELRLRMRQLPIYRTGTTQQVYYDGTNPQNLQQVNGPLPAARQWPSYPSFLDVTDQSSDLHQTQLSFTIEKRESGLSVPGAFQPKKAFSGTISMEGESYRLIKQWLVDDLSAPNNAIAIELEHVGCGTYQDFVIKASDIQWCEDGICRFDVIIKQQDELITCIKNTLIADDWQGWYRKVPANGKKHPRFAYCNEQRPNGMLVIGWYNLMLHAVFNIIFFVPLVLLLNVIIAILLVIEAILNAFPTVNVDFGVSLFTLDDVIGPLQHQFIESAGCGREHPASLIRDYITNVCDKCGVRVDATTAPLFFSPNMRFETSDRGVIEAENPYYLACMLYAPVKRGIRRNNSVGLAGTQNTTEFYIPDNAPILALDQFLDQIKGAFNAEWRIRNGYLYIARKDYWQSDVYVYDFSETGNDRIKIVEGICYEPNELRYPASCLGLYAPDASDTCGNEAGNSNGGGQMNGYASFANTDNNPNFEGILDKTQQLGATKFRLDGASTDYLADAMQVISNGAVFTPFVNGILKSLVVPALNKYADYALLMSDETATLPKILCWDGKSYLNARCVMKYGAYENTMPDGMPDPNPVYNPTMETWGQLRPPETKVIGGALTIPPTDPGRYVVTDYFGIVIYRQSAVLVNYPMYFSPQFRGNLWDYFHHIDDPRRNPTLQRSWSVKIQMCCEDLQRCGVFDDASDVILGQKVKLPNVFYPDGLITDVVVNYDPNDTYGRHIELRGTQ